ncbi:MAG TPA: BofC C-terminal domain-containing protein [Limnochordia bacterium]|nr:BofC C-terminal domain-containing protein [Limnochordia bacterium]
MSTFRSLAWTLIATVICAAAAFAYAFLVAGPPFASHRHVTLPGAQDAASLELERAQPTRLAAGARLVKHYVFPDGHQGPPAIEAAPISWQGLSLDELKADFPGLHILAFDPKQVVVEQRCAASGQGGFIGLADGRVAVFEGSPNTPCRARLRDVDLGGRALPGYLLSDLGHGIPFRTHEEMVQLLDGITSSV